jgi:hypothetical protein
METNKPRSPSDPRPGNKPAYISALCPRCGRELVLADRIDEDQAPDQQVWNDEWTSPFAATASISTFRAQTFERGQIVAKTPSQATA